MGRFPEYIAEKAARCSPYGVAIGRCPQLTFGTMARLSGTMCQDRFSWFRHCIYSRVNVYRITYSSTVHSDSALCLITHSTDGILFLAELYPAGLGLLGDAYNAHTDSILQCIHAAQGTNEENVKPLQ